MKSVSKSKSRSPSPSSRQLPPSQQPPAYLRVLFAVFLVAVAVAAYIRFGDYFTLLSLKSQKSAADAFIRANRVLAPALFTLLMTLVVGFNVPGATFMSLCAGLFFEQPFAAGYAFLAYTLGAVISYTTWRIILGNNIREYLAKTSDMFAKFEEGIRNAENFWDTVSFLVFIRYVAFFPFWFVNASCAALGIGYGQFVLTTAAATVPGALLYTMTGRMLGDTLAGVTADTDSGKFIRTLLWKAVWEDKNAQLTLGLLIFCATFPLLLRLPKWLGFCPTRRGDSPDEKAASRRKNSKGGGTPTRGRSPTQRPQSKPKSSSRTATDKKKEK